MQGPRSKEKVKRKGETKELREGKGKGERSNTIEEKRRGKADGSEEKASDCSE